MREYAIYGRFKGPGADPAGLIEIVSADDADQALGRARYNHESRTIVRVRLVRSEQGDPEFWLDDAVTKTRETKTRGRDPARTREAFGLSVADYEHLESVHDLLTAVSFQLNVHAYDTKSAQDLVDQISEPLRQAVNVLEADAPRGERGAVSALGG